MTSVLVPLHYSPSSGSTSMSFGTTVIIRAGFPVPALLLSTCYLQQITDNQWPLYYCFKMTITFDNGRTAWHTGDTQLLYVTFICFEGCCKMIYL